MIQVREIAKYEKMCLTKFFLFAEIEGVEYSAIYNTKPGELLSYAAERFKPEFERLLLNQHGLKLNGTQV